MILWRLSDAEFADAFNGGYGLKISGRWNSIGKRVTYAASSPALCILEKLVHIVNPLLIPDLVMVEYNVPDELTVTDHRDVGALHHATWRHQHEETKKLGDRWYESGVAPILAVPSAIASFEHSPDLNFMVNHEHPEAKRITIASKTPYQFDRRLVE